MFCCIQKKLFAKVVSYFSTTALYNSHFEAHLFKYVTKEIRAVLPFHNAYSGLKGDA